MPTDWRLEALESLEEANSHLMWPVIGWLDSIPREQLYRMDYDPTDPLDMPLEELVIEAGPWENQFDYFRNVGVRWLARQENIDAINDRARRTGRSDRWGARSIKRAQTQKREYDEIRESLQPVPVLPNPRQLRQMRRRREAMRQPAQPLTYRERERMASIAHQNMIDAILRRMKFDK